MTHDESDTTGVSNADAAAEPRTYEWTAFGRPTTAVVEGVADATGRNPADVAPPERRVDAETLNALVESGREGDGGGVSVSFTLDGVAVTIDSDGTLEVRPDEAGPDGGVARPRSDSELNEELKRVLNAAFANEVNVLGGWAIRNGVGIPDWDVHVTRISKPTDEDAITVQNGVERTE